MFTVTFRRGRKVMRLHKSSINKLAAARDLFLHAGTDLHPDSEAIVNVLTEIIEAAEQDNLPDIHPRMARYKADSMDVVG